MHNYTYFDPILRFAYHTIYMHCSLLFLKDKDGAVNLKFIHNKRRPYFDRQIRPGFSAKRYLSTWTRSWDDSVLEKVISKGKS